MWQGRVDPLHIVAEKSLPMATVETVRAIPGVGLEGDRYATGRGTYSEFPEDGRQVTLFEQESLEAIRRDFNIALEPHETRRNIITRDVPLNHLVGRKSWLARCCWKERGLNAPCQYFEDLLGIKSLFKALIHRSGLNCRILTGGESRVGDIVQLAED